MFRRTRFALPVRSAPLERRLLSPLSSRGISTTLYRKSPSLPRRHATAPLHSSFSNSRNGNGSRNIRSSLHPLTPRRNYAMIPNRSERQHNRRLSYAQLLIHYWRNSPFFRRTLYVSGAGLGVFVVSNIESVPVSGRKRFNWVSPQYEEQMGDAQYRQLLQELHGSIMPDGAPEVRAVRRVLNRLIPNSGISDDDPEHKWEVHVIDEPVANAFVLPGGKVFVSRGILPICGDDDGLATVLGHEIAHNVAHHSAENMSRMTFVLPVAWLASLLFDVSGQLTYLLIDLGYSRPGSRRQESEADFIGLMMMAQSCYNPEKAIGLWQRMEKAGGAKPPQFLSTHPSDHNRVLKIQDWLPRALERRDESACGATIGYAEDFKKVVEQVRGDFWPAGEGEVFDSS